MKRERPAIGDVEDGYERKTVRDERQQADQRRRKTEKLSRTVSADLHVQHQRAHEHGYGADRRGDRLHMADRLGAKYQLQKSIAPKATMCHLMSTGWVTPSSTNNKVSVARAMTTASSTAHIRRTNVATII